MTYKEQVRDEVNKVLTKIDTITNNELKQQALDGVISNNN